jgi:5-methylcytosine-specific restriction endonuclease McrA
MRTHGLGTKQIKRLRNSMPQVCVTCGATENLSLDHIIPVSNGGHRTDRSNLQILCVPCNQIKGSDTIERVVEQLERKRDTEEFLANSPAIVVTTLADLFHLKKQNKRRF